MEVSVIILLEKDTFLQKCIDCLQQTKKPEEIVIIIHEDDEETNKFIKNLNTIYLFVILKPMVEAVKEKFRHRKSKEYIGLY